MLTNVNAILCIVLVYYSYQLEAAKTQMSHPESEAMPKIAEIVRQVHRLSHGLTIILNDLRELATTSVNNPKVKVTKTGVQYDFDEFGNNAESSLSLAKQIDQDLVKGFYNHESDDNAELKLEYETESQSEKEIELSDNNGSGERELDIPIKRFGGDSRRSRLAQLLKQIIVANNRRQQVDVQGLRAGR